MNLDTSHITDPTIQRNSVPKEFQALRSTAKGGGYLGSVMKEIGVGGHEGRDEMF